MGGSKKYIKYRDLKYAIAFDTEKKFKNLSVEELNELSIGDRYSKDFSGFNTLEELDRYCKDKRNNSVYQMINKSIVKLYFDFDKKDFNGGECSEEYLNEIIDSIINGIKTLFNETIDKNDFIVEVDKNYPYKSVHMIIDNWKCNVYENKLLSKYLIDNGVLNDNSVYSKYRQFRLIGMKKIYKTENDILVSHKVYGIDKEFGSRIITNTDKCKLMNMIDSEKEKLVIQSVNDMKTDKIDLVKTNEKVYIDYIDSELIYKLLTDLDSKFYTNGFSWCGITKLLIRDINVENNDYKKILLNDWLRISSEKSGDKYSESDNIEWFKSINKKEIDSISNWSINTFMKICNKYLVYDLSKRLNTINIEMIDYMVENGGLSKYEVITTINDTDLENEDTIDFNIDTYWNIKNQYLVKDNQVYNYNEIEYLKRITELNYEIEYNYTITDINEMKIHNKKLIENTIGILVYKAKWGTGKSFYGMKDIIENMIKNNSESKILIITENNSLNSEVLTKYKHLGFRSHTEKDWEDSGRLIISVESSIYIDSYDWDLVILDEYETILNQYESEETLSNVKVEDISKDKLVYHNYKNLIKMIKSTDRLLVMDADISKNRIDWLLEITDKKIESVYIDINNFSEYTINQYLKLDKYNSDLENDFKMKKKLLFSSNSKKTINKYFRTFMELNKCNGNDMKLLSITGDGAEIDIRVKTENGEFISMIYQDSNGNNMNSDKLKELVKKDIEKFVIDNDIDILLYTPSIKTGISMNELYFDKHYSFGRCGSVNCRTYNQMLYRARKLKDKCFNVYISGGLRLNRYIGIDRMGEVFMNISSNFNSNNYKNGLFNVNETDKMCMDMDNHYFNLRMNNKVEDFNSNNNFNSDFITKMKIVHKLNHKYILDTGEESEMGEILSNVESLIKKERLELLVNTELINDNEYSKIKEKVDYNKVNKNSKRDITKQEWNEKYKYEMLVGYLDLNEVDKRDKRYYFKNLNDYYILNNESNDWNRKNSWVNGLVRTLNQNEELEYLNPLMKTIDLVSKKCCIYQYKYEDNWENEMSEFRKSKKKELGYGVYDNGYIDIIEYLYHNRLVDYKEYKNDKNYYEIEEEELYFDTNNGVVKCIGNIEEILDMVFLKDKYTTDYNNFMGKYNEVKMNSYDLINTTEFYDIWECKNNKDKYYNANRLLNDKVVLTENGYGEKTEEEKVNELIVKKTIKYNISIGYIKTLLEELEITDIRKTIKYTNKEFRTLLFKKLDKLIELDNDYSENLTELNEKTIMKNDFRNEMNDWIATNDKIKKKEIEKSYMKKYKNIISYLNDWFGKINVRIKFMDKNVNSDSGKLKISFNENHKFNSELEIENIISQLDLEECEEVGEVDKIRKGYKDKNKKSVYKYETSKYEETDNYNINWDFRNKMNSDKLELVLNIDFDYEKTGTNEIFKRYKKKHSKHLIKKKVGNVKDIIDMNYESSKSINWCKYNNLVMEYSNERLDNLEQINQYENPLKEEIEKNFMDMNSPVIVKNEIVELKECCLIE